jgi:excisionase family DNA binding protein
MKTKPLHDDWITTTKAAELTGYTVTHIRRLIKAEKVSGRRFGRDWQVGRKSLAGYQAKVKKIGEKRGPKPKSKV